VCYVSETELFTETKHAFRGVCSVHQSVRYV